MPPHDGVRLHDHQRGAPLMPTLCEQDPKESITCAKLRALTSPREGGQLLPKRQVLKSNRSMSPAHQADRSEEYDQRCQHAIFCRPPSD
jgi:hypothetical protein